MKYKIFFLYICLMDLKQFLEQNPLINKAELARRMWPDNKSAATKLANKLSENTVGSGKQRVTENDMMEAKRILTELSQKIQQL